MKTTNEILTDVAKVVLADSAIVGLSGEVYKKTRPTNSDLNDCVIHLIPGTSAKLLADGAIYIKLFYNDINTNDSYYEDTAFGQVLEQMLIDLSVTLLKIPGYAFQIQTREHYTEAVEEIHQHYAILKMNFKLLQK